jgi:WD40 repeat protein
MSRLFTQSIFILLAFFVFNRAPIAYGQKSEIVIQKKHSETITAVAISKVNNLLITGDFIGKVKCWDLLSKKLIATIDIDSRAILQIEVNEKLDRIGVMTEESIFLLSLEDFSPRDTISAETVWEQFQGFSFIPKTKNLAVIKTVAAKLQQDSCYRSIIDLYDAVNLRRMRSQELKVCNTELSTAFLAGKSVYYVLENGNHILEYQLGDAITLVHEFSVQGKSGRKIKVSQTSGDIFLSGGELDSIYVIDGQSRKLKSVIPWSPEPRNVKYPTRECWIVENQNILCTSFDATLNFWDLDRNRWSGSKKTPSKDYKSFTCGVFNSMQLGFVTADNDIFEVNYNDSSVREAFKTGGSLSEAAIGKKITFDTTGKTLSLLNKEHMLTIDLKSLRDSMVMQNLHGGVVIYRFLDSSNRYHEKFYISQDNESKNYYCWSLKNVLLDSVLIPDTLKEKMVLNTYFGSEGKLVLQLTTHNWYASPQYKTTYYLFYDLNRSHKPLLVDRSIARMGAISPSGNTWITQYDLSEDPGKVNQFISISQFGHSDPLVVIPCGDSLTFLKKISFMERENLALLLGDSKLFFYNLKDKRFSKGYSWQKLRYDEFKIDSRNQRIFFYSTLYSDRILMYDYGKDRAKYIDSHSKGLNSLEVINEKVIAISSKDDYVRLIQVAENRIIATLYFISFNSFIVFTPEGYYYNNNLNPENVGFRVGNKIYGLEQYDMVLNRPDLVLTEIGFADSSIVEKYRRAYAKRLEKNNLPAGLSVVKAMKPDIHISLLNKIPEISVDGKLTLQTVVESSTGGIKSIMILINNIPVFGSRGIVLAGRKKPVQNRIEVQLNNGRNKIQFFAIDENGFESFKETYYCTYNKGGEKPTLYFIGIGCSIFKNAQRLPNVDNDIRSFVREVLEDTARRTYRSIIIDTFINENAGVGILKQIKNRLAQTKVDDVVILYFAGHGFKIGDADYFLSSYETVFSNVGRTNSFTYPDLENLLDGIPARKKLFLLNACYSGEGDKDLDDFLTMKKIFPDIRVGNGSIVIASSENTAESKASFKKSNRNSVFGYYVVRGISRGFSSGGDHEADSDHDGQLLVSEWFEYIREMVEKATKDYKPEHVNYRSYNYDSDFAVF